MTAVKHTFNFIGGFDETEFQRYEAASSTEGLEKKVRDTVSGLLYDFSRAQARHPENMFAMMGAAIEVEGELFSVMLWKDGRVSTWGDNDTQMLNEKMYPA